MVTATTHEPIFSWNGGSGTTPIVQQKLEEAKKVRRVTQDVQTPESELSEAERRRRLASVYRLLIELGQQGNDAVDGHTDGQEPVDGQTAANS
jgi:hypothetical protein